MRLLGKMIEVAAVLTLFILVIMTIAAVIMRGNDSNLLIVFYVQIMPDDFVMQLHRF
ncbi:hypothetical protein AE45_00484 [Escherichia coli BIDMC 70]|nr:hypothetical protein AE45_00484 [Escherichia coli BIDMC 70]